MNDNPLKNWLKEIQLTKIKKQAFGSSSERSIGKSQAFSNPGPGAYNPPLKDSCYFFIIQLPLRGIIFKDKKIANKEKNLCGSTVIKGMEE